METCGSQWLDILAPLPAEVLRDAVADREARLAGRPERRSKEAEQDRGQTELAQRQRATGRAIWPSVPTWMPCGRNTTVATAAVATDRTPPSGKPMKTLARIVARSLSVQRSSTPPKEKKNTS